MGIIHGVMRFLGWKPENEEGERPIYPYPVLKRRQNHYPRNGRSSRSSERLHKMLNFPSLIHKAIKGLLKKLLLIFSLPRPRKTADPILPIQKPAPTISNDPSLVQPLLISSSGINDSYPDSTPEIEPTTFDLLPDSNTDDEELQHDNVDVLSSQEWPVENYSANRKKWDSVIISIPESTYSLSYTTVSEETMDSAVHIGEIALKNIHFPEQSMGTKMHSSDDGKGEEDQRPEEDVMVKCNVVVDEGRWIKHYSSHHRILLVGEGDFSFSACLAVAFGWASNMIATSLDSEAFLKENYKNAPANIKELRSRGCKVMHGIDATKMANHALLGHLTFDRIIFNFPFAGFFKELPRKSQLRRHRSLVSLFLKNAREMESENGEIHISHKTNGFHKEWDLESIASSYRLRLIEAVHFNHLDYPGYRTKYGFGGDNNFNCNPSKTYKFGLKRVSYY